MSLDLPVESFCETVNNIHKEVTDAIEAVAKPYLRDSQYVMGCVGGNLPVQLCTFGEIQDDGSAGVKFSTTSRGGSFMCWVSVKMVLSPK